MEIERCGVRKFAPMKLLCAYLLAGLVLFAGTKNLLFLVDYQVNRDYYELICENQNRPELDCHGKCQAGSDSKQSSAGFSFSHFSFNFYASAEAAIPERTETLFVNGEKIGEHTSHFRYALSQHVPNPPPDLI